MSLWDSGFSEQDMETSNAEDWVPDHCRRCPVIVACYHSEIEDCLWSYAFYLRQDRLLQDGVRE